jgi:1,4-dihydroxy-2-naphthoate octaprenyltransferase
MSELSTLQIWWLAIRPKTLWAAVAPVMIGAALAADAGPLHGPSLAVTLAVALLVQIGTNLSNDYSDFKKGTDTADRIGPMRVSQAGLVTSRQILLATVLVFGLTLLGCGYLVSRAGWPLAVIGVLSIASGILYTAGPYPLGYIGLADIFVLVFFGPVAVGGTYYIQTGIVPSSVVVAGLAPGLLATAILVVNNLRDIDSDRAAGKKSLAVRFGRGFARGEYLVCVVGGTLIPVVLVMMVDGHLYSLLAPVVCLALAVKHIRVMFTTTDGPTLNATLAATAKILLIYAVLFSAGWMAS